MRVNKSSKMIPDENRIQIPVVSDSDTEIKISVNLLPLKQTQALSFVPIQVLPELFTVNEERQKYSTFIYNHSIVTFSLLILAVAIVSLPLIKRYYTFDSVKPLSISAFNKSKLPGLNIAINKSIFDNWLNDYTNQTATLNLGVKTVSVNPSLIKSWVTYKPSSSTNVYNVHLNSKLVNSSLVNLAQSYQKKPIDQVSATKRNGISEVAVYGRNGYQIQDIKSVSTQADQIAKNLFSNKGFNISAPLVTLPYKSNTPADFNKLILVDVNSKVMNVYQDGKIVNNFLVSAGALATPTPIGEYHIYAKYAVQDMRGYNPNGTKYFQPKVKWVSYFSGADAVHGVYWHPLSWFGVHNSSHGCVGLPDSQAQWIYNWAPIGTTVITTPN